MTALAAAAAVPCDSYLINGLLKHADDALDNMPQTLMEDFMAEQRLLTQLIKDGQLLPNQCVCCTYSMHGKSVVQTTCDATLLCHVANVLVL